MAICHCSVGFFANPIPATELFAREKSWLPDAQDVVPVLERAVLPFAAADFPRCSLVGIDRRALVR